MSDVIRFTNGYLALPDGTVSRARPCFLPILATHLFSACLPAFCIHDSLSEQACCLLFSALPGFSLSHTSLNFDTLKTVHPRRPVHLLLNSHHNLPPIALLYLPLPPRPDHRPRRQPPLSRTHRRPDQRRIRRGFLRTRSLGPGMRGEVYRWTGTGREEDCRDGVYEFCADYHHPEGGALRKGRSLISSHNPSFPKLMFDSAS